MSEKIRGKRAATDELARKKRNTVAAAPLKPGGISLGGDLWQNLLNYRAHMHLSMSNDL